MQAKWSESCSHKAHNISRKTDHHKYQEYKSKIYLHQKEKQRIDKASAPFEMCKV